MTRTTVRDAARKAGTLPVVLALLVLVMVAAAMSGPRVTRLPMPAPDSRAATPDAVRPAPEPVLPSMTPGTSGERPAIEGLATGALIVGFLIAVFVLFAVAMFLRRRGFGVRGRRLRTRPETAEAAEPEADDDAADPEIRAAVEAGIGQLDDESDPRRAVIGCWLRLESAAQRAGVEHRPDDTPADLVTRMLTDRAISAELLTRLADLYRHARYGPDIVDEHMRVEARSTLARLRTELARPAGPRASGGTSETTDTETDTEFADEDR